MGVVKVAVKNNPGIRRVTRTRADGTTTDRYEVRVKDAFGKTVSVGSFATLADARAAQVNAKASMQTASFVAPSAGKATFLKVAEDWLAGPVAQSKPRTRHGYDCLVHGKWIAPLHRVAVNRLTHRELSRWVAEMVDAGLRPATVRHNANVVRAVLREAVAQGLISKNPMASVTIPKLGKATHYVLTEGDVARLIAHLADHDDPRWAVLVTFAAYTGARAGEIAGLRVKDLNLLKRSVRIERAVQDVGGTLSVGRPKSDNGLRTVAGLPRELCDGLTHLIAPLGPDDYVFGWVDAAGVSHPYRHANFARRVFAPAAAAEGLPARRTDGGVGLHTLRHFHATLCLERGMTPIQVAKRLGHEDATLILKVYGHAWRQDDAALADLFDSSVAAGKAAAQATNVVSIAR